MHHTFLLCCLSLCQCSHFFLLKIISIISTKSKCKTNSDRTKIPIPNFSLDSHFICFIHLLIRTKWTNINLFRGNFTVATVFRSWLWWTISYFNNDRHPLLLYLVTFKPKSCFLVECLTNCNLVWLNFMFQSKILQFTSNIADHDMLIFIWSFSW